MRTLILFLLMTASAFGSITERYVTSAGAGDGTGSSEANAMTFANFVDYMSTGGSFTAAAGDRFNLKLDGVYARTTTADAFVNGGASNAPVIIRGYKTTIGDGYQGRTVSGTGNLNTNNMPEISYTTGSLSLTGNNIVFESVYVTGAKNGNLMVVNTGVQCILRGCLIENNNTGTSTCCIAASGTQATFVDCDIRLLAASGGASGINTSGSGNKLIACRITGKTASGVIVGNTTLITDNAIYNSLIGIDMQSSASQVNTIYRNTITGCSSNGIKETIFITSSLPIMNNMITDNAGFGIDAGSTTNCVFVLYNRFRDNVMGNVTNSTDFVTALTAWGNVTTDTGGAETDYVAAGSQDYRLISTSPAITAGIPQFSDIGAVQSTNGPASGGGSGQFSFPIGP